MSTKFLIDYSTRPLHFFGSIGLLATWGGTLIGSWLAFKKLVLHQAIMLQNGPMLFAATLLILVGVQILCLGLVAEILSRTYYESQKKPIYATRQIQNHVREVSRITERVSHPLPWTRRPMPRSGYVVATSKLEVLRPLTESHEV